MVAWFIECARIYMGIYIATVEPLLTATPEQQPCICYYSCHKLWSGINLTIYIDFHSNQTPEEQPPLYITAIMSFPKGGHHREVPCTVYLNINLIIQPAMHPREVISFPVHIIQYLIILAPLCMLHAHMHCICGIIIL